MYQSVLYDVKDKVATITLHRPEAFNAFRSTAFDEVTDALERSDKDPDVQVVIITGSGKHFSVGGDIKAMQTTKGYISYESAKRTSRMSGAAKRCSKPVVAMINGAAAGAGCGLALASDFRVMTAKSSLSTAFIDVGLTTDTACLYHLCNMVGLAKTLELMMLNTPIKGEEALRLGLATRLAPEDKLEEVTMDLVATLKAKPPIAMALQKKLIYEQYYSDYEEYCELESKLFDDAGNTKDHLEAVVAFLEKRKPVYRGI